jgi:hypothetical protein
MTTALTPQDFYDLMRYYAYGECIECRAATLNLNRGYADFLNSVFRYAGLLFADPETFTPEELEDRKKDMWQFAWENQLLYLRLLRDTARLPAAKALDLEEFKRTTVTPRGMMFSVVRTGYMKCVEIDQRPCSYVQQIESRNGPPIAPLAINTDVWAKITLRVQCVNDVLSFLRDTDTGLHRAEEKQAPAAVVAGIYVFVSHLGRAFVQQYLRPDSAEKADERHALEDESNDLLEKSLPHLERAIFDAYKEILLTVLSRSGRFHESGHATGDWWIALAEARQREHDRKDFEEKLEAYQRLEPGIRGFLAHASRSPD